MNEKFTTSCLIHKNTPSLRKKLEELGYEEWSCYEDEPILGVTTFNFRFQSFSLPNGLTPIYFSTEFCIEDYINSGYIDCGENEDLFLGLAALREDSDYMQWFIYDVEDTPLISRSGICIGNGVMVLRRTKSLLSVSGRKATPEELIKYFQ